MNECVHRDKTTISVEVDSGLVMLVDSHCNACHDRVQERDKSQAALVPDLKSNWSMTFDVKHLGHEADLMKAALDFIALLKKREICEAYIEGYPMVFSPPRDGIYKISSGERLMNNLKELWEKTKSFVVKYRNWGVVFLAGYLIGAMTIICSWVM